MQLVRLILTLIVLPVGCLTLTGYCIVFIFKQIRRQIRLYNSITLVELRASKLRYWLFVLVLLGFVLGGAVVFRGTVADQIEFLKQGYGIGSSLAYFCVFVPFVALLALIGFLITLAFSKCAIVDRGIHTDMRFLDWYHVHDYIIDEARSVVILSSSPSTYLSLYGTTPPYRVQPNDIPKLIFILNKNKNKFSTKFED